MLGKAKFQGLKGVNEALLADSCSVKEIRIWFVPVIQSRLGRVKLKRCPYTTDKRTRPLGKDT